MLGAGFSIAQGFMVSTRTPSIFMRSSISSASERGDSATQMNFTCMPVCCMRMAISAVRVVSRPGFTRLTMKKKL